MYGVVCIRCAMRETKKVWPDAKSETGSTPAISTRDQAPLPTVNHFGVSTVEPGYGVLPKKVFGNTAEAFSGKAGLLLRFWTMSTQDLMERMGRLE